MHYFICYDIASDRLRNRAAKVLLRHGCRRLQKSVFLAYNFPAPSVQRLQEELEKELRSDEEFAPPDSLLIVQTEHDYLKEAPLIGDRTALDDALSEPMVYVL